MAWHRCFHHPAVYAAPPLPWPASAESRHLLRKGPHCSPAVTRPFVLILGLATNIPAFHVDISLFEHYDIEADSWDCFYWLSVC
eukprot:10835687-Ditylum_brightwellii.AAC.1